MGRNAGGSDQGRSFARVDRLDSETLGLVQSFLGAQGDRRTAEAISADAWGRFYAACAPLIHKLARRDYPRRSQDDEDRAQEVWLVLLAHLSHYDSRRCTFPGWLARVVRNVLATQDRREHALRHLDTEMERQLPSRDVDPSMFYERCQTRRAIADAIDELRSSIPEITYRIIYEHWVEDKSFSEIATIIGLTAKQVRDRHHRAMGRVRRILARVM
jgi:RNA polymerase sigma factor (sigma-70 family)